MSLLPNLSCVDVCSMLSVVPNFFRYSSCTSSYSLKFCLWSVSVSRDGINPQVIVLSIWYKVISVLKSFHGHEFLLSHLSIYIIKGLSLYLTTSCTCDSMKDHILTCKLTNLLELSCYLIILKTSLCHVMVHYIHVVLYMNYCIIFYKYIGLFLVIISYLSIESVCTLFLYNIKCPLLNLVTGVGWWYFHSICLYCMDISVMVAYLSCLNILVTSWGWGWY